MLGSLLGQMVTGVERIPEDIITANSLFNPRGRVIEQPVYWFGD